MGSEVLFATFFNLGVNLLYTVLALAVGVYSLLWIDKKLLKSVNIEEELKNGNMAIAVFASTVLVFVALIVSFGLKG